MNKLHRKGNDDAERSIASHHRIGHLAFVNGVSGRGRGGSEGGIEAATHALIRSMRANGSKPRLCRW